ncbi:MAG: hypothetical protein NVSMB62_12210 [Acidobacteriaceae bacterium]
MERERAQELSIENQVRVDMALDGASAGVFEWHVGKNLTKWSNGFYRLHGLKPGDHASYEAWKQLLHPEDLEHVETEVHRAVAEVGSFSAEYRVVTFDDSIRWILCQGSCSAGADGHTERVTGYCGDVTRRKLADLALLQSEKLAIAGRLSATIAHEVNNPLEAAINLVFLANQTVQDPQCKGFLEEATQQLERVSQITRQTLLFSRSSMRPRSCHASELVDAILRLLGPKLRMAGVEVTTETRGNVEFLCSPGEMQQVLTNILNNAVEAMDGHGHIRIRVQNSVDWKDRTRHGVRFTIGDTACGMSPVTLKRMRDPFFTTKDGTGTGLGMWVVSELIEKHKGTVAVRSSMDARHHGTVLSLFIPFAAHTPSPT